MAGKIILGGGGNDILAFDVENIILKDAKNIVYIPVARRTSTYNDCLKWFTSIVSKHNKDAKIKMITDLSGRFNLQYYDTVYIGGGNTFKLLKEIKESGFGRKLIEFYKNGGSIFGGSAGAIIFGRDIETASMGGDENEVNLKEMSGLNICNNHDIQCHYKSYQGKEHLKYSKETKHPIIAIPEESGLLIEDGKFKAIGTKPLTVIKKPVEVKYKPESYLSL